MRKPIIGISGSLIIDEAGMFPGYKRSYVNDDYIKSIVNAGGIPFIIPFNTDMEVIISQVETIDGLVLSGGHDISPFCYGEEVKQRCGDIFPDRDYFELSLLEKAEEKGVSILGICRGCQLINVFHGGSLTQDISYSSNESVLKHNQAHFSDLVTQDVILKQGTKLRSILNKEKIRVNSFHHQLINEVAKGLEVSSYCTDGIVESIENETYKWEIGVQWHPEMLQESNRDMKKLFSAFIQSIDQ